MCHHLADGCGYRVGNFGGFLAGGVIVKVTSLKKPKWSPRENLLAISVIFLGRDKWFLGCDFLGGGFNLGSVHVSPRMESMAFTCFKS